MVEDFRLWRWIRSFIVKNSLPYGVKIFLPNDVKKCLTFASFLPQDYCYNRTNMGIKFTEHAHVLEYIDADCYRLLGANYPYVILPCNSTTYTAWLTEHISFSSILPPLVKI